jgi:hypothetical protein
MALLGDGGALKRAAEKNQFVSPGTFGIAVRRVNDDVLCISFLLLRRVGW